jgi:hypothetical protein
MAYKYTCLYCKKPFSSFTRGRKYCSCICYQKVNIGENSSHWCGGQIKRICITCGKEFKVYPCVVKRGYGKFCSQSCLGKKTYGHYYAPKKELYCIICNKKFYEYVSRLLKEKNRGKCCSKECRIKYTQQRTSGSRSYRWKGGITKINALERSQMAARNWSKAIKRKDNYTCRICGDRNYKGRGKSIRLESHHVKSWKDCPELRYDLNNGITACYDCHKKILKGIIPNDFILKVLDKKADLMNACLEMLKK